MLKLKWFGHSMWQISSDEVTIITDQYLKQNEIELTDELFSQKRTITLEYEA